MKLKVENLGCERNDRYLFSGLNFELASGELIRVDGANGSGKTTLLRMASGLLPVDEGIVCWGDRPIQKNRADYMSELLFVGHKTGIKDELTAEENLRIDHSLAGGQSGVSYESALDRLDIAQCRHQLCRQLSAGQRQRVALARLLISVVRLWVLDEPLTALDRSAQNIVRDMLEEHVGAGGMALITSHQDLDWQGRTQRTIRLGDG
ncbi:cytochrome c biogenesis heme-transporting ATPase CcmA [Gammaproteobacteria bacterium]|nr:cytochrome c biogenesis heme-transporting ATPase CcmA [Gammaproteobacteria bacterium]